MHYLHSIIGEPSLGILPAADGFAAVLTDRGFAVCEPAALDTGWRPSDEGDPAERCEFRGGRIHIRVDPAVSGNPDPWWGLNLISGWIVILPFQSLPPESRRIFSDGLPEGHAVPPASVAVLRRVMEAHRTELRRRLRLQDALADAGYPSPLVLQPTGLHSSPLRIYAKNRLTPLPLPADHRLDAILLNWSGGRETVRFASWRVGLSGDSPLESGNGPLRQSA